jgi:hypothetical protein
MSFPNRPVSANHLSRRERRDSNLPVKTTAHRSERATPHTAMLLWHRELLKRESGCSEKQGDEIGY